MREFESSEAAGAEASDAIGAWTRRALLGAIGRWGGGAAMYHAMTALGHAAPSQFTAPPQLQGAPRRGKRVLVLGAGLAGMLAAYELRKAGYEVKILEYQDRPGGRAYTLRGGYRHEEMGAATQHVRFAKGNYLNPGPWRIPHHHRALLHYCKQFGVALEPFIQLNHNAYVHNTQAFGGQPQRYKAVAVDFKGHVAELLAKATQAGALDQKVSAEDREKLLEAMRAWGLLDADYTYASSLRTSAQRGYARPPGGGVQGEPTASPIFSLPDVLTPQVWTAMGFYFNQVMQTTMFQPVGGMEQIGLGFAKQVGRHITYNAKVTQLHQGEQGVRARWTDLKTGGVHQAEADWCVCTVPASVLGQMDLQVSAPMQAAIRAVGYSTQVKIGLEMRRRFWEEDDHIYGGHSFTNQPISLISYPNDRMFSNGPAVLLGAFANGAAGLELAGMTPDERIEAALAQGSVFHPASYRKEFMNGASVAWSRVPWIQGCTSRWTEEARRDHYPNLVAFDGRVVLAGEHASYYGGWMEGSLLSALDAVQRLHQRAVAGA